MTASKLNATQHWSTSDKVIRFHCLCGKNLKATMTMAGRKTLCPACRNPVVIPTLAPTHRETVPQTTFEELPRKTVELQPRHQQRDVSENKLTRKLFSRFTVKNKSPARDMLKTEADAITLRRVPRWKRLLSHPREARHYHSFEFTFSSLPILFRLTIALAFLSTVSLDAWLGFQQERSAPAATLLLMFFIGWLFVLENLIGNIYTEFSYRLRQDRIVTPKSTLVLGHCLNWMGCFLAGPIVLFCSAAFYWIYCGELSNMDWLIIAEMVVLGITWWLLAIVLSGLGKTLRIPTPWNLCSTLLKMSFTAYCNLLFCLIALLSLLASLFYVNIHLHDLLMGRFLLLCVCWTAGVYTGLFALTRLAIALQESQANKSVGEENRLSLAK